MSHEPEMLSADRHRLLKEHLMSEIAQDSATTVVRPRRRLGWLVAPPLVIGLAAVMALAVPGHRAVRGPEPLTPAGQPTVSNAAAAAPSVSSTATAECPAETAPGQSATPTSGDPIQVLAAAAKAAASLPAPEVKDNQFIYIRTAQQLPGKGLCVRKEWIAADGKSEGLILDPQHGKMGLSPDAGGLPISMAVPSYRYLAALPTEPQQLLQRIYAEGNLKGNEPNGASFRTIENVLMSQLVTPAVGGAFCQAAAAVPGATVEADAVDALGRHGIGVVRADATERMELIFDRNTCEFLGERNVLLVSGKGGAPVGSVFSAAVELKAVTDKVNDEPKS